MLSYHSCHIYRKSIYIYIYIYIYIWLGEILKLSYGGQATKGWELFLLGKLTRQNPMQRFYFSNWRRARFDEMVKKWGKENFMFYAIVPALYPFW